MQVLTSDPHLNQPILTQGSPLESAQAAMVLVHGRGASAADILSLASEIDSKEIAYLAPQAAGSSWYPDRFLVPTALNEPWLSSALNLLERSISQAVQAGIPYEKIILLGFSQGACLALEYAARNAKRYGGVVGLSGGLIGADDAPRSDTGNLAGTPVFLGCSDIDFHIPEKRVHHAASVLSALGGNVDTRIYPGMGHTVIIDEIQAVQNMVQNLLITQ